MTGKAKKLFLVVNVDWFFVSHRLPIALEAKKKGYEVTVFAIEEGGHGEEIRSYGLKFIPIPTSRSGTNIFTELKVLWFLYQHYRREKPDVIHHVAVKPVTYGSLAAKWAKIPRVVNALSGLGFLFINAEKNKWVHSLVTAVFKYGFNNPNLRFILQNQDDFKMIQEFETLNSQQIFLIKGSGVSLTEFDYTPEVPAEKIRVVLPARMLWDKGVGEFVEAAKILAKYQDKVAFILAGNVDMGNKAGIEESQLLEWTKEGHVEWIGFQKDMVKLIKNAHVIVLPSYREGLPKSLIEACAIGRAIVTTDVPGCREVVQHGVNGFLVEKQNAEDLAAKIESLIFDKSLREKMGKAGRELAQSEFSIDNVIEKTLDIYEK